MPKLAPVGIVTLVLALASPLPVASAFFWVDTVFDNDDWNPGDGYCSTGNPLQIPRPPCTLRAAIQETNATPTSDEIGLPAGTYVLTRAGQDEDQAATGDLDIYGQLAIYGAGADETIVDGNGLDRVFAVHPYAVVSMYDLTVTGGSAAYDGGGLRAAHNTRLELVRCHIRGNRAQYGGGLSGYGEFSSELIIEDSLISGNTASASTGGLRSDARDFRLRGTTVAHNRCEGSPTNQLLCAGGLSAAGSDSSEIRNSTISGNTGAGIFASGDTHIVNTTIVNNQRGLQYGGGTLEMVNTIVASNSDQDCWFLHNATLDTAGGHNLSSDASCGLDPSLGDFINADPWLHPLGHFRPPDPRIAPSHHPRWGAWVVDGGKEPLDYTEGARDQDGYPRLQDGDGSGSEEFDIGAIEVLPCALVPGDPDYPDFRVTGDFHASAVPIIKEACRRLVTDGPVVVSSDPGQFVAFRARDSVALSNGFAVVAVDDGTEVFADFRIELKRDAGAPP